MRSPPAAHWIHRSILALLLLAAGVAGQGACGETKPIQILHPAGGEVYLAGAALPPPGPQIRIDLAERYRGRVTEVFLSIDGGTDFTKIGEINKRDSTQDLRNTLLWKVDLANGAFGGGAIGRGAPSGDGMCRIKVTSSFASSDDALGLSEFFTIVAATTFSGKDHGALTGLLDDDHPQYLPRDGSKAMTGPLSLPGDPTDKLHAATKAYVDNANTQQDLLQAAKNAAQDAADASKVSKAGDNMTGPLTVNGAVESASGGFKFPDGTTQSTALVGAGVPSGYSILGESSTPPTGFTYTGFGFNANSWTIKAPMSTPRKGIAAVTLNGKIYVLGGYNAGPPGFTAINEEYDPGANSWTTKAPMPTARTNLVAVSVNGKIYAIGGHDNLPLAVTEEYDPSTNTWSTKAAMPTAREQLGAAVANGKIFVVGGTNGGPLTTNEEYDPFTNTWSSKAPMPTAREHLSAVAVNGKVYALGGETSDRKLNEEYDVATNTWSTKTPMAEKRYQFGAAVFNGKIVAIGGVDSPLTVEQYDPSLNSWIYLPPMPTPRYWFSATASNSAVYAFGGNLLSGGATTGANEALSLKDFFVHKKD